MEEAPPVNQECQTRNKTPQQNNITQAPLRICATKIPSIRANMYLESNGTTHGLENNSGELRGSYTKCVFGVYLVTFISRESGKLQKYRHVPGNETLLPPQPQSGRRGSGTASGEPPARLQHFSR